MSSLGGGGVHCLLFSYLKILERTGDVNHVHPSSLHWNYIELYMVKLMLEYMAGGLNFLFFFYILKLPGAHIKLYTQLLAPFMKMRREKKKKLYKITQIMS